MIVNLSLEGTARTVGYFGRYGGAVQKAIGKVVADRAYRVHARVVRSLSQAGTGRLYSRRGRTHRASAPGKPPATDLGRLRASYAVTRSGPASFAVGTNVRYAPLLERGTRRMAARPHLLPALEAEKQGFIAATAAVLREASKPGSAP